MTADAEIEGLTAQLQALSERIERVRNLVRGIHTGNPRSNVLLYISDLEQKADALKEQIAKLREAYEAGP